ncbi:MAG: BatD family protein [Polyangiaceae bacterium]
MRRGFRSFVLVLATACAFVALPEAVRETAIAYAAPAEGSIRADANVVGVGDTVRIHVQVSSSTDTVTNGGLGPTPGFKLVGQSAGPSQQISIVNGQMTQKVGIQATYELRAEKVGDHVIGPATVVVGGAKAAVGTVRIKVVPADQAPRRPSDPFGSPFGGSAFDPWKSLFQGMDDAPDPARGLGETVPTDPKYALDAPRGQTVFLHAVADKTQAVVGEQITLSVYIYIRATEDRVEFTDVHEPSAGAFTKHSLSDDDKEAKALGYANVGGELWAVRLARKIALFPLKTGDLELGPMSLVLKRRTGGGERKSESVHVRVTEPPVAGRPVGYTIGDVGKMTLTATVSPNRVERGGVVSVQVALAGTGNLPGALSPPLRAGVEWLDPEVHEALGVQAGDRWGGTRTFSFVVRAKKEGALDLGEFALPFWDPEAKSYGVARAKLGTVDVTPSMAAPVASAAAAFDPLAGLPAPWTTPIAPAKGRTFVAESPIFWAGSVAVPASYGLAFAGLHAARAIRKRRRERGESPREALGKRLVDADAVSASDDGRVVDAATLRVLEALALARAGVNLRGLTTDRMVDELTREGFSPEDAALVRTLYAACELARYSPEASDPSAARSRLQELRDLVKRTSR